MKNIGLLIFTLLFYSTILLQQSTAEDFILSNDKLIRINPQNLSDFTETVLKSLSLQDYQQKTKLLSRRVNSLRKLNFFSVGDPNNHICEFSEEIDTQKKSTSLLRISTQSNLDLGKVHSIDLFDHETKNHFMLFQTEAKAWIAINSNKTNSQKTRFFYKKADGEEVKQIMEQSKLGLSDKQINITINPNSLKAVKSNNPASVVNNLKRKNHFQKKDKSRFSFSVNCERGLIQQELRADSNDPVHYLCDTYIARGKINF